MASTDLGAPLYLSARSPKHLRGIHVRAIKLAVDITNDALVVAKEGCSGKRSLVLVDSVPDRVPNAMRRNRVRAAWQFAVQRAAGSADSSPPEPREQFRALLAFERVPPRTIDVLVDIRVRLAIPRREEEPALRRRLETSKGPKLWPGLGLVEVQEPPREKRVAKLALELLCSSGQSVAA